MPRPSCSYDFKCTTCRATKSARGLLCRSGRIYPKRVICKKCEGKARAVLTAKWYRENGAHVTEKKRKRRAADPAYRLIAVTRARVRKKLVLRGIVKSNVTAKLIGCTPDELRKHLESRFARGMTWQNYGSGWHVDHVVPCAAFDLSKPEQQARCFHFSNLQPLWAKDNLLKGANLTTNQFSLI